MSQNEILMALGMIGLAMLLLGAVISIVVTIVKKLIQVAFCGLCLFVVIGLHEPIGHFLKTFLRP